MTPRLLDTIIPVVIYFVFLFAIFSFMEVLILIYLERAEVRYHEALARWTEVVRVHYEAAVWTSRLLAFGLFAVGVYFAAPAIKLDLTKTPELTIFSGVMLLTVTLLYYAFTHAKSVAFGYQIHHKADKVLYVILSVLVYVFMIILVHQRFPQYKKFITDHLVDPAYSAIAMRLDEKKEHDLLVKFRAMLLDKGCPYKDFRGDKNQDLIHQFIYVINDPSLGTSVGSMDPSDPGNILRGKTCTDGQETFVLTAEGSWYWLAKN